MSSRKHASGASLVELIVAIVIIGIALPAVLAGIARITRSSADPMILAQASAIAEAYLEEILLKDYEQPGGTCAAPSAEGETDRGLFDDVDDYHSAGAYLAARDQNGMPGPANYEVRVTITCADLGPITAASGDAKRIEVAVRNTAFGGGDVAVLSGYRARY